MRAVRNAKAPTLLSAEECKHLGQRILAMVAGSQAHVRIGGGHQAYIEFARGDSHIAAETGSPSVQLNVQVGTGYAEGRTNQIDEAGLQTLVREVETLARERPTQDKTQWTAGGYAVEELLGPQVYTQGPPIFFDATVAAMASEAQAELFRRATDATEAAGLIGAGALIVRATFRAVLNTRGLWAYERSTFGDFSLTARTKDGTGSGWAGGGYEDWRRVDVAAIIARAVDLGRRSAHPVAVEPGRYTVILEPAAVAVLIEAISGWNTRLAGRRCSDCATRLGVPAGRAAA